MARMWAGGLQGSWPSLCAEPAGESAREGEERESPGDTHHSDLIWLSEAGARARPALLVEEGVAPGTAQPVAGGKEEL